jgi:hypothetical protein
MSVIIEEITRQHNRKIFDCGVDELNQFLQHQSRQKTAKQVSKTYLACKAVEATNIIACHTLTGYSIITPPVHKNYIKYPHPFNAVKLARLVVASTYNKQRLDGWGQVLYFVTFRLI